MKFSDFHPKGQKWPKWAPFSLEKQSIFHMWHIGAKKCEKCDFLWNFRKKWKSVKCAEICGKSAKIEKFTKKCEKCEKYENGQNSINISLDFIRYFAHWRFWHKKSEIYAF